MPKFRIFRIGTYIKRQTDEEKIQDLTVKVRNGEEAKIFKELVFYREIYAPMMYQNRYNLTKQLSNDINGTFLQGKLSMINEIEDFIEKTIEKGKVAKPELDKLKEKQSNE